MINETRYEYKTVKSVRGADRLVAAKWEKRGWELVEETSTTVRTVLTFRRPKPRVKAAAVVGFAVVAVLVTASITIGVLTEDDNAPAAEPAVSDTAGKALTIEGFLAARRKGNLELYAQQHNSEPLEFDALVEGVGPDGLKTVGFLNLRAIVEERKVGPVLKLVFGGFSQIPFPAGLESGERVRVRANIDRYFDDDEVWLSPDDPDSFVQAKK